ncbi:MAG: alpha/beta hydrolase family protein [Armatimonadota bacterium]
MYNHGFLYIPKTYAERPAPAVLCPHGHWPGGNVHPAVQSRCLVLAKLGYVVFSPFQQHFDDLPLGISCQTVMIWNNIRALDYLESRPDVDRHRIGCTGCSGGGLQTQMLIAVDDRVKAATIVGMTCEYREIMFPYTAHCRCNHFPNIMRYTDQPEISTLSLPLPVQYLTMDDWTHRFRTDNFPAVQALYAANDAQGRADCQYWATPHLYDQPKRERMYAWMQRWLRGGGEADSPESIPEPKVTTFLPEELAALTLDVPEDKGFAHLGELARARLRYRERPLKTRAQWRAYHTEMKAAAVELLGEEFALPRTGAAEVVRRSVDGAVAVEWLRYPSEADLQIPAILAGPAERESRKKLPVAILLDDRGKDRLWADEGPDSAAALAAGGSLVLLPDVRFHGELQLSTLAGLAPEHLQHKPFSHMREPDKPDWNMAWTRNAILWGRPLPGQAATDLQAALDFLSTRPEADLTRVRLVAAGRPAAAALLAAVLDPRFDPVELDFQGRSFGNGKLPLVPSVLRHGDVCQWAAALADRSVTLTGLAEDEEGVGQLRAAFEATGDLGALQIE